jgi:hypothetical protein
VTSHHSAKLCQLENELRVPLGTLPVKGESRGYLFTEVQGVTVLITRKVTTHEVGTNCLQFAGMMRQFFPQTLMQPLLLLPSLIRVLE